MSFELKKDQAIPKGVRRIVCKRIDKALNSIQGKAATLSDHAVHDARKRFKEIRGTLRLVRHELGEKHFQRENRTFRDAGRPLSALRDAKVLIDTLDGLVKHFNGKVKPQATAKLRRKLVQRRRETRNIVLTRDRSVSKIVRRVSAAKKRVDHWPLHKRGWKAIAQGLRKTYAQGREAMHDARDQRNDLTLHEWRKRAKDLRYGLELLQAVWPEMIAPMADQAHQLTNLLGEDHDLAVLAEIAREESGEDSSVDGELLLALIDERRKALQQQAEVLGQKVYQETAGEFVSRIGGYWRTARHATDEGGKDLNGDTERH